jgi:hypothetical protein
MKTAKKITKALCAFVDLLKRLKDLLVGIPTKLEHRALTRSVLILSIHQILFNQWRSSMKAHEKKQTKKDKMDESISMKNGKESTKKQSMSSRRDESKGMMKKK